jgi:outer membrane protein
MKKLLALCLITVSFSAMAEIKVGIVNIQKVITSIAEGKSVMETLEKSFKSKQTELKKEEDEIKKMQQDYQKQNLVLSEQAKAKKEGDIRTKIQALQQKTMQFQKEIQDQEAQLKKPILEKLSPVVDEVSKKQNVAMTFEISSSPLVYVQNKVDITEEVIQEYDKKFKKK